MSCGNPAAKHWMERKAFDLYATYGLPFEIARDIAREQDLDVDEAGFRVRHGRSTVSLRAAARPWARWAARMPSSMPGSSRISRNTGKLGKAGVEYNPYEWLQVEGAVLALVCGWASRSPRPGRGTGSKSCLPKTGFYVESGGQVSDTGLIRAADGSWEIEVTEMRKPSPGAIVHVGEVVFGHPKAGDPAVAVVDAARRHDIRRNHTATHLLHAALHQVLGENARQAGSLVAPDRFRFDFNHPEAMTPEQVEQVEKLVNEAVAADYPGHARSASRASRRSPKAPWRSSARSTAMWCAPSPSATRNTYSYELCGGTHLDRTSDVGAFLIVSEEFGRGRRAPHRGGDRAWRL